MVRRVLFCLAVAVCLAGSIVLVWHLTSTGVPGLKHSETDSFFVALTGVATLFLGIGTVWLGYETKRLGDEDKADRRENVRPVLVFESARLVDLPRTRSARIRNVGPGPALDCIYVYADNAHEKRSQKFRGTITPFFALAPGEASDSPAPDKCVDLVRVKEAFEFFNSQPPGAAGDQVEEFSYEAVTCTDIVGRRWWFWRSGVGQYGFGERLPISTRPVEFLKPPRKYS